MENKEEINLMTTSYFKALFNGYHRPHGILANQPFRPDFSGLKEFFRNIGTLSEREAESMIGEITLEEVEEVIKGSSYNKSPGLDGLSYELYKGLSRNDVTLLGGRATH